MTAKTAFEQNQLYVIVSYIQISLDALTTIMDLIATPLAARTYGGLRFCNKRHVQAPIVTPFLC
ncbi:hypothetical protein KSC_020690 [Ktedonobacter sp. SOSP1-52]|uniref:hypothetical protein n=1 Tax=Ktedonobacter sp. SOSP1-52 TaxID=2778366 RepID=UPI001A298B0F|nr:hypothetical protein [Ktedonobacter sp. SOSP1-52]GHO63177.1 hypothetical protein KSC_020690 [Ktedonobacter sp. SOSP1-52]